MHKARPIARCALLLSAFLVALAGCKRAPGLPAQTAPTAPATPPRFCDQDLSGVWVNASDRHFAYRLHDHGDTIRGDFFRRGLDGGAEPSQPAEPVDQPMIIELHRTQTGLAGLMRTTDRTAGGRNCPVEFGLQIPSCSPESVQVIAETTVPITEECTRQKLPDGGVTEPTLVEYAWDRESRSQSGPDHPSDGGDPSTRH